MSRPFAPFFVCPSIVVLLGACAQMPQVDRQYAAEVDAWLDRESSNEDGSAELDTGGWVESGEVEDIDGDGWSIADGDCDDFDDRIYPGAPDAWYDHVDSDCAGNDDFDADRDRFVPEEYEGFRTKGVPGSGTLLSGDCNDRDRRVFPTATDIPYDGIDSDCMGDDDFDLDGDGYPIDGGDCVDDDITIHPGADDVPYDGIDSDCMGDDDFDIDRDGYRPEDGDCDDFDALIYPGAVDAPYDGIDADCAGDTDFDVDGDGLGPDEGDCDDFDARVHPGAAEVCDDGLDNNCDGAVDETCTASDVDPGGGGFE